MEVIKLQLVVYPQKDKESATNAKRESEDVYSREKFVSEDIPESDQEIVLEHNRWGLVQRQFVVQQGCMLDTGRSQTGYILHQIFVSEGAENPHIGPSI